MDSMQDRVPQTTQDFYLTTLANGWQVGHYSVLEKLGIPHLISTRQGLDVNAVRHKTDQTVKTVARSLRLRDGAYLNQVHGNLVLPCSTSGLIGEADALYTNQSGIALVGKSADCPLILVAETNGKAVGFAHASWRSTVACIVERLITRLNQELDCQPHHLIACICPSAGPECYEVGPEVRDAAIKGIGAHAGVFFKQHGVKLHFDLWKANSDALLRCGLRMEHIHVAGLCTLCRNDLFPSHRKEGEGAGRFVAAIGLTSRYR